MSVGYYERKHDSLLRAGGDLAKPLDDGYRAVYSSLCYIAYYSVQGGG